jgi:hypothetical protein
MVTSRITSTNTFHDQEIWIVLEAAIGAGSVAHRSPSKLDIHDNARAVSRVSPETFLLPDPPTVLVKLVRGPQGMILTHLDLGEVANVIIVLKVSVVCNSHSRFALTQS